MIRRTILALTLLCFGQTAWAQNTTCADRPTGDSSNACANTRFVGSASGIPSGRNTGPNCIRMWPAASQDTTAWNVVDAYGNAVSTSGTTSQGLQEAINYSVNNGQCLQVYGQGSLALGSQSTTLNSTTTVTGLTSTSSLLVGDYVVASAGGIPLFTKIASIDGPTQIHISNAATVTATRTLTFTRPAGANRHTFITSSSTIQIPPVEQWSFQAYDVNLTCASTLNAPCLQFDSAIIMGFDWIGGQIVYQPGTPTANSIAVHIAPTNPVPLDGVVAVSDSHIFISNVAVPISGTAQAVIGFDLAGGSITTSRFTFNEINGTGTSTVGNTNFGMLVYGPTASTAFEQNIINIAHNHLSLGAGLQIGVNSTNAANLRHNVWLIGGIKPSGTASAGISSFGSYDTFLIGAITNEEGTLNQGINLQASSAGNKVEYGQIVGAGTALIDGGSCNSWAGANGTKIAIYGVGGCNTLKATGPGAITLPAGTTDFSATGGASQFVKQVSVGAPFTVVQPTFTDLATGTAPAFTLGGPVSGGGNQINNVIIGTSTPLAGTFTSLTVTGSSAPVNGVYLPTTNTLGFAVNSLDALRLLPTASSVNYATIKGAATGGGGNRVTYGVDGSDTDISIDFVAKGSGCTNFDAQGSNAGSIARFCSFGAGAANGFLFTSGASGSGSTISAQDLGGTGNATVDLNLTAVGAGTGKINVTNTTVSTSRTTGAIVTGGGLGVAKGIFGDTLNLITVANVSTTRALCWDNTTGLVSENGTVGTCTVSDERLKNFKGPIVRALDKLLQIHGMYYTWKDPKAFGSGSQIGIGAQTVEKVFPELVSTDSTGRKSADYQRLVAPIIEALRELKADNDNLRIEIANLKGVRHAK